MIRKAFVEGNDQNNHDEVISRTESHPAMTNSEKKFTHEGVDVAHLSATDF